MAPPAGTLRVGRYFLALLTIIALLYLIVFYPGARHTPKLGLDLEGGQQVIFTAKTIQGNKTPSRSSMDQAKQIMEDRVNGSGVTEATVVIQGSNQIVVSIPGATGTDVTKLGAAAVLNFRGLVAPSVAVACQQFSATTTPSGSPAASTSPSGSPSSSGTPAGSQSSGTASVHDAGHHRLTPLGNAAPTTTPTGSTTPTGHTTPTGSTTPTATATSTPPPAKCSGTPFAALEKSGVKIPTSDTAFKALSTTQQSAISAALANYNCDSAKNEPDVAKTYFVACDDGSQFGQPYAYLLGSVIVPGHEISSASAVAPNASAGQLAWTVALNLKSSGQTAWGKYTSAHNINGADTSTAGSTNACGSSGTPCADYVGFTLDGVVISAPVNVSAINGGTTQISGSFTSKSAKTLANQLKYGALPLTFTPEQAQTVSATLGSSQLKSGLLAGGIGLVLVVIYSLMYYRALGLVTIASLVVSGILTYGSLVMLATQIGFTLSLAGIAGFIVAIGITADSFVVFFERIKDEVHEGRSVRVAIPRAWIRARRTILSADTVSFLAAAILYYFAAGDVKGFAFTLGLSTILDLLVVFLFTHPLVSWLSRKKAFGSARFTGLNAVREGGISTADDAPKARVTKPARTARAQSKTQPATSAVAVLDDEDSDEPADEPATPAATTTPAATAEPTVAPVSRPEPEPSDVDQAAAEDETPPTGADDTSTASTDAAEDDPTAEPRRTTPEPGSAAERAAARRARLREKGEN